IASALESPTPACALAPHPRLSQALGGRDHGENSRLPSIDAVHRHAASGRVAVCVELEAAQDAVLDARPEQVPGDRRTRTVGGRDRVEQHLCGLGHGGGGGRCLPLDRLLEGFDKAAPRGGKACGVHDRDADHNTLGRPTRLLDERFRGEAVRCEDLDTRAEGRTQITHERGSAHSEDATEKDPVGPGPLDPLRHIFEVTAAKLPARGPGNADSELPRGLSDTRGDRDSVRLLVIQDVQPPHAELLGHQGVGGALDVVRGHYSCEVADTVGVVGVGLSREGARTLVRQANDGCGRADRGERAAAGCVEYRNLDRCAARRARADDPEHGGRVGEGTCIPAAGRGCAPEDACDARLVARLIADAVRPGPVVVPSEHEAHGIAELQGLDEAGGPCKGRSDTIRNRGDPFCANSTGVQKLCEIAPGTRIVRPRAAGPALNPGWTDIQTLPWLTATPVGAPPTGIERTAPDSGSIRATVPSPLSATQTAPAPVAIALGVLPTPSGIVAVTAPRRGSMRVTLGVF